MSEEFNVVARYSIDPTQALVGAGKIQNAFATAADPLKKNLLDLRGVARDLSGGLRPVRDDLRGLSKDVRATDGALTRLLRSRRSGGGTQGAGTPLPLRLPGMGLGGGLLGGALLGGLTAAARGVARLNAGAEQGRTTIATLLATNGVYEFNDALAASRGILSDLRADAAVGVGEIETYQKVYAQILSPALQAGAGLDQIRQATGMLVAAGTALRGSQGAELAGFDVNQALNQGLGDRTTPILNQAVRAYGQTLGEFNKLGKAERFTTLLEALKKFEPAIEAQGQTWDGVTSTLTDNIKGIVMTGTEPLFGRWLENLRGVNRWMGENREQIDRITTLVGEGLVRAWDRGVGLVKNWRSELQAAIPVLTTIAALQLAGAGGGGLLVGAGQGILSAGKAGRGAVSKALTPKAAPMLGPVRNLPWVGEITGGIFTGFGAAVVKGLNPIVMVGSKMLAVLKPLAPILGPVGLGLTLISAGLEAFTANTFGAASWLKEEAGGLFTEVRKLVGGTIGIFSNGILRTIGAGVLAGLSGIVWALKWGLRGINAVVAPISAVFQLMGLQLEAGLEFVRDIIKTRSLSGARAAWEERINTGTSEILRRYKGGFDVAMGAAPQLPDAKTAPTTKNVTYIDKVEVNQKVETNADPDRVAWGWNDMLTTVQKRSKQARALPVPVR